MSQRTSTNHTESDWSISWASNFPPTNTPLENHKKTSSPNVMKILTFAHFARKFLQLILNLSFIREQSHCEKLVRPSLLTNLTEGSNSAVGEAGKSHLPFKGRSSYTRTCQDRMTRHRPVSSHLLHRTRRALTLAGYILALRATLSIAVAEC